jgi:hypothetical protein
VARANGVNDPRLICDRTLAAGLAANGGPGPCAFGRSLREGEHVRSDGPARARVCTLGGEGALRGIGAKREGGRGDYLGIRTRAGAPAQDPADEAAEPLARGGGGGIGGAGIGAFDCDAGCVVGRVSWRVSGPVIWRVSRRVSRPVRRMRRVRDTTSLHHPPPVMGARERNPSATDG